MFVCFFVGRKPEKLYCASSWEGSKLPWEWSHTGRGTNHDVHIKDSGTNHVLVNLLLTPELTAWLAS